MSFADSPAMRLRTAYLTMHRAFQRHFRGSWETTADQFVVLSLLAEADAATQRELVERSGSDPNTIAAMLSRLEARGLVERTPHEADARALRVRLTAEGRRLRRQLAESSRELHALLESTLDEAERGPVLAWLARVADTMSGAEPATAATASLPAETAP